MAIISRTLIDEYDGHGFAAQYSKYANNAKNDENNNPIAETYATKDELNHVAPSGATPTSSLTCTGADTFAWAGWTQASIPIPPPVKKYLGIAYLGYTEGINLLPNKYSSTFSRNFLDNQTYNNLKTYIMPMTASTWDELPYLNNSTLLDLWNQDKDWTFETMFYTDNWNSYQGFGWSRRGYSGGGTPNVVKNSSFQLVVTGNKTRILTYKDMSYTERASINKYISEYAWHHLATTYDSASKICTIFIDGSKIGTVPITWTHDREETFTESCGSVTQVAVYDYVAYKDNFTVPTIPHIYNDEYMLKAQ
jgi:hypothetical protein